jgi:hypothetical protein
VFTHGRLEGLARHEGQLLGLLLIVTALRALVYSQVVPLWQAPDEPGHFEYACTISWAGRFPTQADVDYVLERAIIASLDRADFWRRTRQAQPVPLPASFAENRFLRASGSQLGDEPPTYYLIPAVLCRLNGTIEQQARLIRWYSIGLLLLATGVAWRAAHELWPGEKWLANGVPAFYALAPMPTFIGMSINNDGMALLASTAFFWALVHWCRHGADIPTIAGSSTTAPDGRSAPSGAGTRERSSWLLRLAVLSVALGLALLTKRTTLFILPVAVLVLLWDSREGSWITHARNSRAAGRYRVAAAVVFVLALCGLVLGLRRGPAAEAWRSSLLGRPADRVEGGHNGHYALLVTDTDPTRRVEVSQGVGTETTDTLLGSTVVLTAWLRASGLPVETAVVVADGPESASVHMVRVGQAWQAVTVTHAVSPVGTYLRAAVGVGRPGSAGRDADFAATGTVLVDDVTLTVLGNPGNLLRNGGAELGSSRLEPWLATVRRLAKLPPGWPGAIVEPMAYSRDAMRRYGLYVALTFAGFWGNFGWLQWPLPMPVYAILMFVCVVSIVGLIRLAFGRVSLDLATWQCRALRWMGIAVFLALTQVFLPMIGRQWQPQGRYLFPALWPLVTFMLLGLGGWFPASARKRLLGLWVTGLILLDGTALIGTILPAFRV